MSASLWAKNEPSGDGNSAVMCKSYRKDYGEYNDVQVRHIILPSKTSILEFEENGVRRKAETSFI